MNEEIEKLRKLAAHQRAAIDKMDELFLAGKMKEDIWRELRWRTVEVWIHLQTQYEALQLRDSIKKMIDDLMKT
jgi:hypothetical protein